MHTCLYWHVHNNHIQVHNDCANTRLKMHAKSNAGDTEFHELQNRISKIEITNWNGILEWGKSVYGQYSYYIINLIHSDCKTFIFAFKDCFNVIRISYTPEQVRMVSLLLHKTG